MFELMDAYSQSAVIKVIGVGGGGGNAVAHMVTSGIEGVEFMCVNTDAQALKHSKVKTALQIGCNITKGLGAGAESRSRPPGRDGGSRPHRRADRGLRHAVHHRRHGRRHRHGRGAGGRAARQGDGHPHGRGRDQAVRDGRRQAHAGRAIRASTSSASTRLADHHPEREAADRARAADVTLLDAFKAANDVLQGAVQGIAELITRPGLINVDFADVRTVMAEMGMAMMGSGVGERRRTARARRPRRPSQSRCSRTSICRRARHPGERHRGHGPRRSASSRRSARS